MLYGLGDICLLKSTSGWTRGDYIESDASGQGVTSTATGRNIGAVALTNTNTGEYGRVQVLILTNGQVTSGSITMSDPGNIILGTTTGTKIGTATNQKLGFFNATPVIQPATTGELIGLNGKADTTANATNMNSNGNLGATLYDYNDIVKALKQVGILAQ
ncbi:hypothetical protein AYO40_01180 [Planctomycetaceae bacterium SCGC AG-212-D15]|nr:hypothetical protein AYO40_01180 [Planctomycetaceae bacterium SCGC AG-212-D15]